MMRQQLKTDALTGSEVIEHRDYRSKFLIFVLLASFKTVIG